MHVAIVAYHFPPDRAVGALRPARLAAALKSLGHEVSVVTAQLEEEPDRYNATPIDIHVHAVGALRNPREFYLQAKRSLRPRRTGSAAPATEPPTTEPERATPAPLWKRSILSLLWLPDDRQGFIPTAVQKLLELHRKSPLGAFITTAPPFSTHIAGLVVERLTGVPWIAEFRDPWTDNPWKPALVRTAATDRLERWLERQVLDRASLVVSASEGIERFFRENRGVADPKLLLVRNGIDLLHRERQGSPRKAFRIVHMGTFYHSRDPRPFLEALARVNERRSASDRELEVHLIGRSREYGGTSIGTLAADLGVGHLVHFHDYMPRDAVVRVAAEADLLLLLAQNQPDQVPNKLYEYLGTRVPILAFADAAGESSRLLEAAGGHYVIAENDVAAAAAALGHALGNGERHAAGDLQVLESWTADRQLRQLTDRLRG